jgi:hypothetical protein
MVRAWDIVSKSISIAEACVRESVRVRQSMSPSFLLVSHSSARMYRTSSPGVVRGL